MEKLKKFFKEEDGVTALEYTLLASLLIFVIMVFFTPIRNLASRIWSEINSFLATT
jgi:Flp pilus assembly pilin Flp